MRAGSAFFWRSWDLEASALCSFYFNFFFPREGVIQGVGELCDLCWKSIAHKLSVCVGQEMALCIVCVIVTDVA